MAEAGHWRQDSIHDLIVGRSPWPARGLPAAARWDSIPHMTLDELKAEVRAASPEVREELFTLLGVLRRARDPARARTLAAKLDEPGRWISEEEAGRRLGLSTGEAE